MQVIVSVQFQCIFEENSSSHQEVMQPVRNAENYPTCEVTVTYIYNVLLIDKGVAYSKEKKRKKRLQTSKYYFSFLSAMLKNHYSPGCLSNTSFNYFY